MATYKYNEDKLMFEKTYKVLKYKFITVLLLSTLCFICISAIKLKTEKEELKLKVLKKEQRIKAIKQPLREETYVKDLVEAIGFKLTEDEFERFSFLALKYRNQIEEAKVPATLVFWVFYKESRFNVKAENNSSTAKGLGQMLDGTWNEMCKMKGYSIDGRFNEQKQVTVTLDYLNYLYERYGSWGKSMEAYAGFKYHYPVNFLLK